MATTYSTSPELLRQRREKRPRAQAAGSTGFAHYITRPILNAGPLLFATAVMSALVFAWIKRDEGYITAEHGLGYWLGIAGGILMLILIAYPLRKRWRAFSSLGRVAGWFRLHMVLGILGPALVVLHTNFKLGSLNSRLALFTMLVVVASGIVGRYLYAKVHRGLYGAQSNLRDVLADVSALKLGLGSALANDTKMMAELETFVPDPAHAGVLKGLSSTLLTGFRTRAARARMMAIARRHLAQDKVLSRRERRRRRRQISRHLRLYFAAVKKAERLALFERIFGLWHHLHMPLFILLALTVTLHIVAVHRY